MKKKKENIGSEVRWVRWQSSGKTCTALEYERQSQHGPPLREVRRRSAVRLADVSASCCRCLTLAKQQRADVSASTCMSLPSKCAREAWNWPKSLCNAAKHKQWLWLPCGDVFWSSCKRRLRLMTVQWLSEKKLHAARLNVWPPHSFLLTVHILVFLGGRSALSSPWMQC